MSKIEFNSLEYLKKLLKETNERIEIRKTQITNFKITKEQLLQEQNDLDFNSLTAFLEWIKERIPALEYYIAEEEDKESIYYQQLSINIIEKENLELEKND